MLFSKTRLSLFGLKGLQFSNKNLLLRLSQNIFFKFLVLKVLVNIKQTKHKILIYFKCHATALRYA